MSRFNLRLARWLIAPVAVAGVVVAVLVAGSTPSIPVGTVIEAADLTGHISGVDIDGTMVVSAAGRTIHMSMSGFESIPKRAGDLTMKLNSPGIPASSESFEMRFSFPLFYMRSPLLASALPAGKHWIEFNLVQALRDRGLSSSLLSSAQYDPTQYVQYLKTVSGSVQNLGTEQIRGVTTTHYHAVTDLSRYAHALPASKRTAAEQAFSQLEKLTGTSRIPIDVWIDSRHLIRQIRMNISAHPSTGALSNQGVNELMTIDLFNFGPKPDITPPAASDTVPYSSLSSTGL